MKIFHKTSWPVLISSFAIIILAVVQFFIIQYAYRLKYNMVEGAYKNVYEYARPNIRMEWASVDSVTLFAIRNDKLIDQGQISAHYIKSLRQHLLDTATIRKAFDGYFNKVGLQNEIDYTIELKQLKVDISGLSASSSTAIPVLGDIETSKGKKLVYRHLIKSDYLEGELNLYISFPNQIVYLFKQMKWVIIFSFIAFFMIAFVAFFNLKNWMKQKRSSEIKDDLINNISHEFKTPITSIALASKSIQENISKLGPDRITELSALVARQNTRLQKLVDSLLTSAFISKKEEIQLTPTHISPILNETVGDYQVNEPAASFSIVQRLNAQIDNVAIDQFLFETAITNLIDNAQKYEATQLVITTKNSGSRITISFCDNGIGILADEEDKIFEKFTRLDNHRKPGLGLGLHHVKTIVEAHQGSVSVKKNIDGPGCTFIIQLPITNDSKK